MSLNTEEDTERGRRRVLTPGSLLSVVSATVLIDSLILVFSCLIIWSVGGYLMLSLVPFGILTLAVALPAVWACVAVAVLAFHAETDPENN
ncbi:hypothetical protein [Roseibium marinum]|uniref:Uncharacterized protein n=1 Tax=Roseibium marinum TaxID=281252 RepID=A0A2S3UWK2_9HYPH|nr:hypothetical protein [Roseibium marinum]POF32102.1 hypothetical protein CLV41_10321 [Roseibium marinum]